MLFTNYFLLGGAALAAAVPAGQANQAPGQFAVSNFVYACTSGCEWSFDLAVQGTGPNHPPVGTPVKCSGTTGKDSDYVDCGQISMTQKLRAYIDKATSQLKLEYEVRKPAEGAVYRFTGERKVYSSTGAKTGQQAGTFFVKETAATGVA